MSRKKLIKMLAGEQIFFALIGTFLDVILGICLYGLIFFVQKNVLEIKAYSAFVVNSAVALVSVDPFIFPIAFSLVSTAISTLVPIQKILKLSPIEAYKSTENSKINIGKSQLYAMLNRSKIHKNIPIFISVSLVMSSAIFGFLYYKAEGELLSEKYYAQLEQTKMGENILLAKRDEHSGKFNYAQYNRHDMGFSSKIIENLSSFSGYKINAVIEVSDARISYENTTLNLEKITDFEATEIDKNGQTEFEKMYSKMLEYQGYAENERVFNLPITATFESDLQALNKYIKSGEINAQKIIDGEEIILAFPSESLAEKLGITYQIPSVKVGEILPLSAVRSNEFDSFDFDGGLPDGIDYLSDENGMKYYVFGKAIRFSPIVGAIIEIEEIDDYNYYFTQNMAGETNRNVITTASALNSWGLIDKNFTRVGVKSKSTAIDSKFLKAWSAAIAQSKGMKSFSTEEIHRNIFNTKMQSMTTFLSLIIMLVALNLLSMINAFKALIRNQMNRISILRAIGMSKKQVLFMLTRQVIWIPVLSGIIALLPPLYFEIIRKIAERKTALLSDESGVVLVTKIEWFINFPQYQLLGIGLLRAVLLCVIAFILMILFCLILQFKSVVFEEISDGINKLD